jgi:hypothetical protein
MGLIGHLLLTISILAAVDPAAEESRNLFEEATAEYETSEYIGAVEKYTKAYELSSSIADTELKARVQAAILFNLARAHAKAYALDKRREHLLQAKDLLEKYLTQTADLKNEADAKQFQAETLQELERLENEDEVQRQARERQRAAAQDKSSANDPTADPQPGGRGLVIGGVSLIGLGIAGGGVATAGAVIGVRASRDYQEGPTREERDAAAKKGQTGNVMLVAGSISAGALLTTGAILAVVGRRRESNTMASAFVVPGGGGLVWKGQF